MNWCSSVWTVPRVYHARPPPGGRRRTTRPLGMSACVAAAMSVGGQINDVQGVRTVHSAELSKGTAVNRRVRAPSKLPRGRPVQGVRTVQVREKAGSSCRQGSRFKRITPFKCEKRLVQIAAREAGSSGSRRTSAREGWFKLPPGRTVGKARNVQKVRARMASRVFAVKFLRVGGGLSVYGCASLRDGWKWARSRGKPV